MSQTQHSVTELFGRYLRRQTVAQAEGVGFADPDGLAIPHEAVPVQPADPQQAWEDALAVVRVSDAGPHFEQRAVPPPDWPALVAALEPVVALAFCIGNFPQMVRNLQPLLEYVRAGGASDSASSAACISVLPLPPRRPMNVSPALLQWAQSHGDHSHFLVSAGVLRLARCFDEADEMLKSRGGLPPAWRALRANEQAALAWHRGSADKALALWQKQKPSVPVLFNLGMAALFLGRPDEARTPLQDAVAQLPETNAWHHLGRLYLALAAAGLRPTTRNPVSVQNSRPAS